MKILYIIDQTNLFGSELHVFDLIKKLGPLNQITLIAFNNGPLINMIKELNLNITVIVIDLSWFPNAFKLLKLINQVKNISPNIIHSHQPKAILYGSIIAKFVGKKHISTIHSIPYVSASIYEGINIKAVSNIGFDFSGYGDFVENLRDENCYILLMNTSVEKTQTDFIDDYIDYMESNPSIGLLGISYSTKKFQTLIRNNFEPHVQSFFF